VVTGAIDASGSTNIQAGINSSQFKLACHDLMTDMKKKLSTKYPEGKVSEVVRPTGGGNDASSLIAGLGGENGEISRALNNYSKNSKWNDQKSDCFITVDLSGVSFQTIRPDVNNVMGRIVIAVRNRETGKRGTADFAFTRFQTFNHQIKAQLFERFSKEEAIKKVVEDLVRNL
jgi:hypothetical protein